MDLDDIDTVDELPARPRRTIPGADRELLGLAARALGAVQVEDVDGEEWLILHFADGSIRHGWNPLLHSDDAFTLAVKLGLLVDFSYQSAMDSKCSGEGPADWHNVHDDDPIVATRRAVTLAAAEIGKAME